jgi:hypothetical protein
VSANKIFLVAIDNESLAQFVVVARSQSALTANSVNGTGAFGLIGADDGLDTTQTPFASVVIGQMIISGGTTAGVNCDINDAGVVSVCGTDGVHPGSVPGVVAFDPATGRGTITFTNGFDSFFVDSLAFYLEANGTGVMLDTTEPADNDSLPEALVGDLIPQTSTADIAGQVQGLGLTGDSQSFAITGEFNVDLTTGDINGLFDGSFPDSSPIFDSATGGMVSGSAITTGRASIMVTGDVFGNPTVAQPAAAYEVNPTQYFVIGETSDFSSSLGIFTPQTLPAVQNAARTAKKASKVPVRRPVPASRQHQRLHAVKPRPASAR